MATYFGYEHLEHPGTAGATDLAGYARTADLDAFVRKTAADAKYVASAKLGSYVKSTDLVSDLKSYTKTTDLTAKLGSYAKTTDLTTQLKPYAKKTDIPKASDLTGYLKKTDAATEYAKKTDIPKASDLTGYLKKTDAATEYAKKTDIPKASDLTGYLKKTDASKAPDLTGYAKKTDIPKASDLTRYLKKTDAATEYAKKTDVPKAPDLTGYAKKTDIPKASDLTGYLKKTDAATEYAKKSDIESHITQAQADSRYLRSSAAYRLVGTAPHFDDLSIWLIPEPNNSTSTFTPFDSSGLNGDRNLRGTGSFSSAADVVSPKLDYDHKCQRWYAEFGKVSFQYLKMESVRGRDLFHRPGSHTKSEFTIFAVYKVRKPNGTLFRWGLRDHDNLGVGFSNDDLSIQMGPVKHTIKGSGVHGASTRVLALHGKEGTPTSSVTDPVEIRVYYDGRDVMFNTQDGLGSITSGDDPLVIGASFGLVSDTLDEKLGYYSDIDLYCLLFYKHAMTKDGIMDIYRRLVDTFQPI